MSLGYFGQILQKILGGTPGKGPVILRDYAHAAKTFRTNGYAYTPKLKFLFHVYFDINQQAYGRGLNTGDNFGLAVKTVKLPSFNPNVETFNQYNRKRLVQTKLKYNTVNITFHDDNRNMMTRLWNAYYTYYFNDGRNFDVFKGKPGAASQAYLDGSGLEQTPVQDYNGRNIYDDSITGDVAWGYNSGNYYQKIPFFKNITIFGMNQHHFTAYTLINPVISNFSHDSYSYNDGGGIMEMNMDLDYETVVYNEGAIDGNDPSNIIAGFGTNDNYDTRPSPYSSKSNNSLVSGQGGYTPANGGFVNKLSRGLFNGGPPFNNDHSQ